MSESTTILSDTIDTWLQAYTEADAERRETLIAAVWNEDGVLVDPPLDGAGRAAISKLAEVVLAQFPGHSFRRSTSVDAHHDVARYGWELVAPDGAVTLTGVDVVQVDEAGRLLRVAGFFGELT